MRLDRRKVKREKNKNSKYKHVSSQSFEESFYNAPNKTKDFKLTKTKPKVNKKSKPKSIAQMCREAYNTTYREFLLTDYWKAVRKKVLRRDGYKCVICKSNIQLQVHHDSYKNHYKEHLHLEDLMTLCKKCHKEHHYAQK